MRITGGSLKGQRLPGGFASHVRPTTDFVREALMNMLQHRIDLSEATVLDLFSGSGIMALEFISRGATAVLSVDLDHKNIRHQQAIRAEKGLNNWTVMKNNVFKVLQTTEPVYDIIFADPPYDLTNINQLPALAVKALKPEGLFILEHRPGIEFQPAASEKRLYGSSAISIFIP
jgi:16S rRNA (guanine(966)-N(2))-methyltransferase RsmD